MISEFDVQRDHLPVITECLKLLEPEGKLFFSNNLRSFKLDPKISAYAAVVDVSKSTIPPDFQNQLIHKAWILSHLA
jgi:23S rRNA (cytosine1962-C5)-methyltransferase